MTKEYLLNLIERLSFWYYNKTIVYPVREGDKDIFDAAPHYGFNLSYNEVEYLYELVRINLKVGYDLKIMPLCQFVSKFNNSKSLQFGKSLKEREKMDSEIFDNFEDYIKA